MHTQHGFAFSVSFAPDRLSSGMAERSQQKECVIEKRTKMIGHNILKSAVVGFIWTPIEWSQRAIVYIKMKKTIWKFLNLFRFHCVPPPQHMPSIHGKLCCVAIFFWLFLQSCRLLHIFFKAVCMSNKCTVIYASSLQREFCCVALFDFSMLPFTMWCTIV